MYFSGDCTQLMAAQAWGDFFKHNYWNELAKELSEDDVYANNDDTKTAFLSSPPEVIRVEPAKLWCDV